MENDSRLRRTLGLRVFSEVRVENDHLLLRIIFNGILNISIGGEVLENMPTNKWTMLHA